LLSRYDEVALSEKIGGLPIKMTKHLAGSDRFALRFEAAVEDWLGPLPVLSSDGAALMALDPDAIEALALRAGAIWHGRAMSQAIGGSAVRALVGAIGVELRQLGLAQGWRRQSARAALDPERIAADLHQDGLACLHAWCLAQPPPLGRRVALRLPSLPEPSDEHLAIGPGIVVALCGSRDAG